MLADGQLTGSSATLVTATGSQYVSLSFFNTSVSATVAVTVTLQREGGTARTFLRVELGPYEGLYVRGLPLDPTDTLAGYADATSLIDYIVGWDRDDSDFLVFTIDKTGATKTATEVTVNSEAEEKPDAGQVEMIELLKEMRAAIWRLAPPA